MQGGIFALLAYLGSKYLSSIEDKVDEVRRVQNELSIDIERMNKEIYSNHADLIKRTYDSQNEMLRVYNVNRVQVDELKDLITSDFVKGQALNTEMKIAYGKVIQILRHHEKLINSKKDKAVND